MKQASHLLKYDSTLGTFNAEVKIVDDQHISVDGKSIKVVSSRDPTQLPWKAMDIDLVIEGTGVFIDRVGASKHITVSGAGAIEMLMVVQPEQARLALDAFGGWRWSACCLCGVARWVWGIASCMHPHPHAARAFPCMPPSPGVGLAFTCLVCTPSRMRHRMLIRPHSACPRTCTGWCPQGADHCPRQGQGHPHLRGRR